MMLSLPIGIMIKVTMMAVNVMQAMITALMMVIVLIIMVMLMLL